MNHTTEERRCDMTELKKEFEKKFCIKYTQPDYLVWRSEDTPKQVWQWIETELTKAKEYGFQAGCDFTDKLTANRATEARIDENERWYYDGKDFNKDMFLKRINELKGE